jgi:hypothetical protein
MTGMLLIAHRINTLEALGRVPRNLGVEIDLRTDGRNIVLHHDPCHGGCLFSQYLEHYAHRFLILNIKEVGIEDRVVQMVEERGISAYFLLDVEFPYLYRAARRGLRNIAIRFSEDESIYTVQKYHHLLDWVWVDTMTTFPVDQQSVTTLKQFKTCLVCPERWGRPQDVPLYRQRCAQLGWYPDAVMTSLACMDLWTRSRP